MKRSGKKKEWCFVLFCAGILVLSPPLLPLVDSSNLHFGAPVSYLFIFGVWALIIAAVAFGARRGKPASSSSANEPPIFKQGAE